MSKLQTKKLEIGGTDYEVREMVGTERFRCVDIVEKEGNTGMAGFLLKRCVLEPEGFDFEKEPSRICETLVNEIIRLSSWNITAVPEAEKKSDPGTNTGSGTD